MAAGGVGGGPDDALTRHLTKVERVGTEILADRQSLLELDRKRQDNRQALRAMHRGGTPTASSSGSEKTWMCLGPVFVKLPTGTATRIIQDEQRVVEAEIGETRARLKGGVDALRHVEGDAQLKGFNLRPMHRDELGALGKS